MCSMQASLMGGLTTRAKYGEIKGPSSGELPPLYPCRLVYGSSVECVHYLLH